MDIEASYEGHGYMDPHTGKENIPSGIIVCRMEGMPSGMDVEAGSRWLRSELATICTIMCSWALLNPITGMRDLYHRLVELNSRYKERMRALACPQYTTEALP